MGALQVAIWGPAGLGSLRGWVLWDLGSSFHKLCGSCEGLETTESPKQGLVPSGGNGTNLTLKTLVCAPGLRRRFGAPTGRPESVSSD